MLKAITLKIGEQCSILSEYVLARLLVELYQDKSYKKQAISDLGTTFPSKKDYLKILKQLTSIGILEEIAGTKKKLFSVLGRKEHSAQEIACVLDPFCYLSHLSAMEYHGLTDRMLHTVVLTTLPVSQWRVEAIQKEKEDFGSDYLLYKDSGLPRLIPPSPSQLGKTKLTFYSSRLAGSFIKTQNTSLRVASLGKTFLDMLGEPNLCGGIYHVLDVYEKYVTQYLSLILQEIDRNGTKLDKVRAGYILEKRCGIEGNAIIESWHQYAQRGGSQKLVASESFSPEYCERWLLSLNI